MADSVTSNPKSGSVDHQADISRMLIELEGLQARLAHDRAEIERLEREAQTIKDTVDATFSRADPARMEGRFHALLDAWRKDTLVCSFVSDMVLHPAYQQIIGMGSEVVPLLLNELRREPDHLFWALGAITGENPVQPEDRGNLDEMARSWLQWGKDKGLE